jgi:hypothetical protein
MALSNDSLGKYTCGQCGFTGTAEGHNPVGELFLSGAKLLSMSPCKQCGTPVYFLNDEQTKPPVELPNISYVEFLPKDVATAYKEAHRCIVYGAYTATAAMCRKVVLLVALDKEVVAINHDGWTPGFSQCIRKLKEEKLLSKGTHLAMLGMKGFGDDAMHGTEPLGFNDAEACMITTRGVLKSIYGK